MHITRTLLLLIAGLLICLPAHLQAADVMLPNDDAVLTKRLSLPYGPPVSTRAAKILAAAAIKEAKKNGWTIDVAVVDTGGILVYFERMNNTQHASPIIAIEKAKTAAFFRRNTKLVQDRVKKGAYNYLGLPGAQPIDGGLPIVIDGQIVGAVAISGARASQDGICARAAVDALADTLYYGKITGMVHQPDGQPLTGGKVVVFRKGDGPAPYPSKYLRPPDERVDIAADGSFILKLPRGDYYFSAIKNTSGDLLGPPAEGDLIYPGAERLEKGDTLFTVKGGEVTDIGTVSAIAFSKDLLSEPDVVTAIKGKVVDKDGQPVAGAIVFAFDSPNVVGKPLFVSERTGEDGRYLLQVATGGSYYIKTRTSLWGGQPVEGEVIGVYGDAIPEAVQVETGETVGQINLVGKPFVDYRKLPGSKRPE